MKIIIIIYLKINFNTFLYEYVHILYLNNYPDTNLPKYPN